MAFEAILDEVDQLNHVSQGFWALCSPLEMCSFLVRIAHRRAGPCTRSYFRNVVCSSERAKTGPDTR